VARRNINGLTPKQQVFCDLFRASEDPSVRGNAKACYMLAYGASDKSAEANGPRLLKNPHVAEYLATKRQAAEEKADVSEERILREVAAIAFLDPAEYFDPHGNLLPIHEMPERARRALASVEVTTMGKDAEALVTKIRNWDKKGSLELLMKHKKMLTDKVEHGGEIKTGGVLVAPGDVSLDEWLNQHYGKNKK